MYFTKSIVAAAFVLVCGVAATHQIPIVAADDTDAVADADKIYTKVYALNDLPVWSPDRKTFNTTLLESHLKASVDPSSWGSSSTIHAYHQNSSLVISTISKNHDAIANTLVKLRRSGTKPESK